MDLETLQMPNRVRLPELRPVYFQWHGGWVPIAYRAVCEQFDALEADTIRRYLFEHSETETQEIR